MGACPPRRSSRRGFRMKLWGGRFEKSTDGMVDDFHSSITFDKRLYKQDIEGSIAHATMLGEQGILTPADADAIVAGLKDHAPGHRGGQGGLPARRRGHPHERRDAPDRAHRRGGQAPAHRPQPQRPGGPGHAACTSRTSADEAVAHLAELLHALLARGRSSTWPTIMPGYTHMQKAQPITLGHHLMRLCRDVPAGHRAASRRPRRLRTPCPWAAARWRAPPIR